MKEYIPFPAYYDDAPVDISWVFEEEKPAGKHGFLKAVNDHFEFEDGTPGRFWGTNFNGGSCFPDHEHAAKQALRLAKYGCNIVRFHQLDAEWNTPNIFNYDKGPRCAKTDKLDKTSMDCLDYFIYQLKNNGIYCYIDVFTYRRFKTEDGVENATNLKDAAKPYACYNRKMIDLQKEFITTIMNHVNPYTGLAYKDDPVFVMGEIVNESDLFTTPIDLEPYATEFRTRFKAWLNEKNIAGIDADSCDINDKTPATPLVSFKMDLTIAYYKEIYDHFKATGVKFPITGSNWSTCDESVEASRVTDFTDNHYYYYDWKWENHCCKNIGMTQSDEPGFFFLSHFRYFDKPMFVSEWDMPWPNAYRAESPILYAAVGSMQNWSGFAIHTYAYSNKLERMNILGKETSGSAIGGVAYREGIFSTWNDPSKFGLFYHAALITRRRDINGDGMKKVAVKLGHNDPQRTALRRLSETYLAGVQIGDETIADEVYNDTDVVIEDVGEVKSENGCLYRSWAKEYGYIDSERTKSIYGFLEKNGNISIKGLSVTSKSDFSVIALSSLQDKPTEEADILLLSTVGKSQNTNAKFDGDEMSEYGTAPILTQVINADIEIETKNPNMVVWSVNPEGMYVGRIPATYEDGKLKFTVGEKFKSIYYIITKE